jgi:hypothetical protein
VNHVVPSQKPQTPPQKDEQEEYILFEHEATRLLLSCSNVILPAESSTESIDAAFKELCVMEDNTWQSAKPTRFCPELGEKEFLRAFLSGIRKGPKSLKKVEVKPREVYPELIVSLEMAILIQQMDQSTALQRHLDNLAQKEEKTEECDLAQWEQ